MSVPSAAAATTQRRPAPRQLRSLVRLLWLQALKYNFRFCATHVPGVSNVDADDLSRGRTVLFKNVERVEFSHVFCPNEARDVHLF